MWTYYGEVEYSYSENVRLINKEGKVEEDITRIDCDDDTVIMNRNDWVVSLVERINWGENKEGIDRETILYIFCPHPAESFEYQDIYDIIAEEDR